MATPQQVANKMLSNLIDKFGISEMEWFEIIEESGASKHGEIVKSLKSQTKLTHGYANLLAKRYLNRGERKSTGDELIANQYEGKGYLKNIYDELVDQINKFGPDVEIAPKKQYVSLRRGKQFAIIQPSTKSRIDVGINLNSQIISDRLEDASGFNSMVTYRVRVTDSDDIDYQLLEWLREAYHES